MPQFCETSGNCDDTKVDILSSNTDGEDWSEENFERVPPRLRKNTAQLKDPLSTGRKEAERKYPLYRERECEWANLLQAGGGEHPIKGCGIDIPVGNQQARHHGPDKNTMNNEKGNVHRICHRCHNKWHAANDEDYDPDKIKKGD
jgi:hypothetical protein